MPKHRNDLTIYDAAAPNWWSDDVRWVRTLRNLVPARLRYFDQSVKWPGARVLDLGCAGGFMAEAMALRGAEVTGIDPAADAVAAAAAHASEHWLNIRYDVGTGEKLPYLNAAFDAVICVDVLEHVTDRRRVLSEVARVLRPGGMFLFDTINRNFVARLAMITMGEAMLGLLPCGTHDPRKFIKPSELRAEMRETGLIPHRFIGLGPTGLDQRWDLTFGRWPGTVVMYMGNAQKRSGPDTEVRSGSEW